VPVTEAEIYPLGMFAGAALLPHAPVRPVLEGMALAGVIHYTWLKLALRRNGRR
jgi:hypothetical protein